MNKSDLVQGIMDLAMQPRKEVEAVLDALAATTSATLAMGGEVTIPGLVKLKTVRRAARVSRNPRTGEPVQVPAKTVVTAKPVKQLADAIA